MSMKNLTSHVSTKTTPQSRPIPGREADQSKNNAGGFVFTVDMWTRLNRFLILGSEGGSYYASEQKLTADNAKSVMDAVKADGLRVVATVVEISQSGRAPKNTPAIFVLALCAKLGDQATKTAAYAALPKVCRIGTHLFQWAEAIKAFGGFSSGTQKALARWYQSPRRDIDPDLDDAARAEAVTDLLEAHARWVALQAVKYQARDGWGHRDMLRLAKPGAKGRRLDRAPAMESILDWVTKGWPAGAIPTSAPGDASDLIWAFEKAKDIGVQGDVSKARTSELVKLITEYRMPRECVPTQYLNEVAVWEALLDNGGRGMPMTAMIRNLGKMSAIGLLKPMSSEVGKIVTALGSVDALRRARVHPLNLLVALKTYQSGHGVRGKLTWSASPQIVDALDKAFYLSFETVETTGKRWLLALDISGSMSTSNIAGMPGITPRIGSAAMALITAASEPQNHMVAFASGGRGAYGGGTPGKNHYQAPASYKYKYRWSETDGLTPLTLSPRQRLDDAIRTITSLPAGGTDCSLPMIYAMERGLDVDCFVVYTDSETWAGSIAPSQALEMYRRKTGIHAKLIVVGMVSSQFTVGDPDDPDTLNVVGFDTAAPNIMSKFAQGQL